MSVDSLHCTPAPGAADAPPELADALSALATAENAALRARRLHVLAGGEAGEDRKVDAANSPELGLPRVGLALSGGF